MKEELEEKNQQLRELNKILQVQAITDSLTGLYNHRQVLEKLQLEIARANRYQQDLTIMMLDIDHFKSINDEFGHQVGDVVLVEVAQIIKRNLRNTDIAGRYGGEEFLIILPQTNLNNGLQVAERIRRQVEVEGFEDRKEGITVSIGISQHQGEEMVDYIERSDQLLYRAKRRAATGLSAKQPVFVLSSQRLYGCLWNYMRFWAALVLACVDICSKPG